MALSASPIPAPAIQPVPIPLRDITPWAIFAGTVGLTLLYFFGIEQSAVSLFSGTIMHEFVHDARHLAGLPCH